MSNCLITFSLPLVPEKWTANSLVMFTTYLQFDPIKTTAKASWFDMQIQTETEVIREVCFSAAKHNDFKKCSKQNRSVKIKKFNIDTTANTKNVLLSSRVRVVQLANFELTKIQSSVHNRPLRLLMLDSLLMAKQISYPYQDSKKLILPDGPRSKVEASLRDPSAPIRISLWE